VRVVDLIEAVHDRVECRLGRGDQSRVVAGASGGVQVGWLVEVCGENFCF